MRFDLNVGLSVSFGPATHKGELTMGQWAQKMYERISDYEYEESRKQEQQSLKRKQILADAPYIWEQLKKHAQKEGGELAKSIQGSILVVDTPRPDVPSMAIESAKGSMMVDFNPEAPRITYKIGLGNKNVKAIKMGDLQGSFSFTLSESAVTLINNAEERYTPEEAAEFLMELMVAPEDGN